MHIPNCRTGTKSRGRVGKRKAYQQRFLSPPIMMQNVCVSSVAYIQQMMSNIAHLPLPLTESVPGGSGDPNE